MRKGPLLPSSGEKNQWPDRWIKTETLLNRIAEASPGKNAENFCSTMEFFIKNVEEGVYMGFWEEIESRFNPIFEEFDRQLDGEKDGKVIDLLVELADEFTSEARAVMALRMVKMTRKQQSKRVQQLMRERKDKEGPAPELK